jgi:hypothetical protein
MPMTDVAPAILYKYYPPERIDIFDNWSARFSSPTIFNDTFDSYFRASDKQMRIARAKLRMRLGIFCLTEDPDNQLMWVHYADQHRGFAIGFNTSGEPIRSDGRELRKVLYTNHPRLLSDEEPSTEVCCYKSQEWAYEREWRCIQQFKTGESRDISLDPSAISEVIVGSKTTGEHIVNILMGVKNIQIATEGHEVRLFRSKPDLDNWSFTHEPLNRKLCDQCEGEGYISGLQFTKA